MKDPNHSRSQGFGPVALPDARVLILGSLPGQVSLARGQYYAHSRNAFWTIMERLFGASRDMPYAARLQQLQFRGVALWDVCASACRTGSLDSRLSGEVPNDFAALLARCAHIKLIAFNGAKASQLFHRQIVPNLAPAFAAIRRVVLPSTSPAYAAMPFDKKMERWRKALEPAWKESRAAGKEHREELTAAH